MCSIQRESLCANQNPSRRSPKLYRIYNFQIEFKKLCDVLAGKFWSPFDKHPTNKQTSDKRKIYIPFAARYLRFLKCSDCSQDKFDYCSCAKKWTHCLHTFKSSQRPFDNHILRPFTLKVNLTIHLLKSHYLTCHPWSQIHLATCYHREIQSTSSYHLKQTQNIRSQKNCSLNSLHTAYTM